MFILHCCHDSSPDHFISCSTCRTLEFSFAEFNVELVIPSVAAEFLRRLSDLIYRVLAKRRFDFFDFAEIEDRDIIGLYIISSDDWSDISQGSFLVRIVSENLHSNYTNCDSIRLSEDIKKKVSFLKSGSTFDTKFIAVSDSCSGPVTFMEGNRRAVALCYLKRLADVTIYLGITEQITNYQWARHTYRR